MKRYVIALILASGVAAYAQRGQEPPPAGRGAGPGRGPTPEQQAAAAAQAELEKNTPQIPYDAVSLPLMPEGHTIGETEGVAINSKKHLFVYTRSGNAGPARGAQAAELFEFDQNNKFVKEWGQNSYGFSFAHAVRVDKEDNVWVVDEGSNMVIKFNPQGLVTMVLGRKDEAIDYLEEFLEDGAHTERGRNARPGAGAGRGGTFGRPTDVTWDTQGNIFVSDGYDNSRVAKFTKDGDFVKSIGSRGNAPDQFNTPHAITSDAKGQHLRRRPRQQPHPGLRLGPEPQGHLQQRARAVGGLHHAAQRAGAAVPLQRRRRRQDLQAGSRRQAAWLVRHERQEGRPVLLGAPDALRQRERALHRRSAELARAAHHAQDGDSRDEVTRTN